MTTSRSTLPDTRTAGSSTPSSCEAAASRVQGLRIGDRNRKVRRLYPNAEPITHAGHTHYRLREAPDNGYMMAKVVDRRVVQLELWPFEFC